MLICDAPAILSRPGLPLGNRLLGVLAGLDGIRLWRKEVARHPQQIGLGG